MTEIICIVVLVGIIIYREVMCFIKENHKDKQIQTLLDKHMSRDYTEYTNGQYTIELPKEENQEPQVVPLEDALKYYQEEELEDPNIRDID